jgi:ribosome biogenesis ATPase
VCISQSEKLSNNYGNDAFYRKVSVDTGDVNFEAIGADSRAEGFSGADLAALVREGGLAVMSEWRERMEARRVQRELDMSNGICDGVSTEAELEFSKISTRHFEVAFSKVRPSVSPDDRAR